MPPKKTPEMVTKLLKEVVARKGQSVVARETGLTQPAISRYLQGVGEPTTETLKKLSDYFGVSLYELRGEDTLIDDIVEKSYIPVAFYSYLADEIEYHLDKALKYERYNDNGDFIDAVIAMSDIFIHGYEEFYDAGDYMDLETIKQKAEAVIEKFLGQSTYYIKKGNIIVPSQPRDADAIEKGVARLLERMKNRPLAYR